jgi:hypothetical protein
VFAWEAYEKGSDVHLQADPTKLEVLAREYKKKKEEYKTTVKDSILSKYGGEEHLEAPPKQLLLAQSVSLEEFKVNLCIYLLGLHCRKIMWSILDMGRWSKVRKRQRSSHGMKRMCTSIITRAFGGRSGATGSGDSSVVTPSSKNPTAQVQLEKKLSRLDSITKSLAAMNLFFAVESSRT